ncbi:MAG TPA: ATP-dependent Clp protease ATP-binding subunit [Flexilinea sp.]|jgi:ATP-dependent Clp protease ATP-binding subunit ClpC|nr:ATP-dependent Clp protease ATP-binding subunit [Flexilinea sp.]OQA25489.1 MAG: ATP-dependent Clp protease ATP-binding subunit ClpC [Chloroflexi bacterium ADurb.Bin344]HOG21068.1 ATP-dependent Clp protease ATP-binding subunit [Flexilinea sp.]HOG61012.1 ATP-dependent Clp protease ATP-binding subunit [Flexilinea sp.]HOR55185.1 ATP-dependent Clp protease ATP-binding subunit [Flexilinea sp.]
MAGIDRFTQRARRVLSLAHQEADKNNETIIGTEHLLIGLLLVEGSTAGKVLQDLDVSADRVREALSKMEPKTEILGIPEAGQEEALSAEVQDILKRAVIQASKNGQVYVSTEHLLLSLIETENSRAVAVLKRLGISPEQIRKQLKRVLEEGNSAPASNSTEEVKPKPVKKQRTDKTTSNSPLIDQLATDLTAKAAAGKLDPVVGRETEIARVIQVLARRTKNNPALVGEPGVGKTAIVEGLAQAIVEGNVPAQLLNKRVLQLDVGSMVAGTMYRGQFEDRMKRVIEELKNTKAILFIDEIHMLVGAGSSGSAVDAANILKPALSRGEVQVVGATTSDEYRKNIESDAALARRFQQILVNEPTPEETIQILKGLRPRYEEHHHLNISDEALEAAVKLSVRYVSERFLPDKAIDLIDEASSRVRMYKNPSTALTDDYMAELRKTRKDGLLAIEQGDADLAASLYERGLVLEDRIEEASKIWNREEAPVVTAEDIAEIVSMWTGIPVMQMAEEESERLLRMEEELGKMIIGQNEAISEISHAIRRSRSGLKDSNRPIGSFLFLGPTGVGKTELTKALAKYLFGSEEAMIQLDMSEFMERHTVSRLTGAPPGYVGYEEAGQLTEAIRRHPYSIVVFDEIDKANPEVLNMLLQIMEEGHLSDARGKKVDFRNTIIVMTSNIGADVIRRQNNFGFNLIEGKDEEEQESYEEMRKKLMDQLKKSFRPEFLNRLDNIVVFRMLNLEDMQQITEIEIGKVNQRLADKQITLTVSESALEKLTRDGFDPEMGARPLRRVIQQQIEDPLSDALLAREFSNGDQVLITLDDKNEIAFRKVEPQREEL